MESVHSRQGEVVKAVIFDVDGTLLDSVDLHAKAWEEAFAEFGHQFSFEKIRSQIGKGGDQLLPEFLSDEDVEQIGKKIEKRRGEIFKEKFLAEVRPFPEVRRLFQRLQADGWKIALASSAKEEELKIYEKIARIDDLLASEVSSDDAKASKPQPDIFHAAIKRVGHVKPGDCVVVGDSPYDAEAATKAGIRSVGFLCGGFPATDLKKAGYEKLYQGPTELVQAYSESIFHRERPGAK